jgi:hypothetical protein
MVTRLSAFFRSKNNQLTVLEGFPRMLLLIAVDGVSGRFLAEFESAVCGIAYGPGKTDGQGLSLSRPDFCHQQT